MDEHVNGLGMHFYWTGTSIIMGGAALVMITSFIACCGAFFRSKFLILVVSRERDRPEVVVG